MATLCRRALLGAAIASVCALAGCTKTQFEREHDAAMKDNPWGVELEIRTVSEDHRFHAGETMHFQELYTSKSQRMWQLEVLDQKNIADVANVAYISDGTAAQQETFNNGAMDCCRWRYVMLDNDPVRLPYRFENPAVDYRSLRLPSKPGKYEIYVQTHRLVMRKGEGLDPETHTGYPLTSGILKIEVTP
ncbi:MAG TPA: hypothetical protein VGL89_15610 [Candidatus Koribacter sp.]|jgi:hypothetical protein